MAALTVWSAEQTRTPSGTISATCWAAEPCQTPMVRVALPEIAAASGTEASTTSCPGRRCCLRFVRVSDCERNGTERISTRRGSRPSRCRRPSKLAPGTRSAARPAASAARAASREPMTTGTPARPRRTARPKPRAPVPPMMRRAAARPEYMVETVPDRSLEADVEALCRIVRDSAGAGRARGRRLVAARLEEVGAADVTVAPYRSRTTYAWVHGVHLAAGLPGARAALAGGPGSRWSSTWAGSGSGSGGCCPAGEGANVVARLPAAGERRATLVLTAHLDAAQTGLVWHPALARAAAERRLGDPLDGPGHGAAGARPRADRAAVEARQAARRRRCSRSGSRPNLDVARSPTVPGASDDASGVAALIALAAGWSAEPLPGVEVLIAAVGGEESGMGGFDAFLRGRDARPGDAPSSSASTRSARAPDPRPRRGGAAHAPLPPGRPRARRRGRRRAGEPAPRALADRRLDRSRARAPPRPARGGRPLRRPRRRLHELPPADRHARPGRLRVGARLRRGSPGAWARRSPRGCLGRVAAHERDQAGRGRRSRADGARDRPDGRGGRVRRRAQGARRGRAGEGARQDREAARPRRGEGALEPGGRRRHPRAHHRDAREQRTSPTATSCSRRSPRTSSASSRCGPSSTRIVKPEAIFATNTSSLSVVDQAASTTPPGAVRRRPLLQPRAGHEARRGHPRGDHERRDLHGRPGVRHRAGQARDRDPGRRGLHRQPAARAVHDRRHPRPRGGHRLDPGDRRRDEGRRRPPDGPADALRLRRPRHARGDLRLAVERVPRGPLRPAADAAQDGRRRLAREQERGWASTTTPASSPSRTPPRCGEVAPADAPRPAVPGRPGGGRRRGLAPLVVLLQVRMGWPAGGQLALAAGATAGVGVLLAGCPREPRPYVSAIVVAG